LTLKGIPEELYERLKARAAAHRRSLNSEVLVCLELSIGRQPIDPEQFLRRLDALHAQLHMPRLTDAELRQAKTEGRT
jgi:plasmid stability protein